MSLEDALRHAQQAGRERARGLSVQKPTLDQLTNFPQWVGRNTGEGVPQWRGLGGGIMGALRRSHAVGGLQAADVMPPQDAVMAPLPPEYSFTGGRNAVEGVPESDARLAAWEKDYIDRGGSWGGARIGEFLAPDILDVIPFGKAAGFVAGVAPKVGGALASIPLGAIPRGGKRTLNELDVKTLARASEGAEEIKLTEDGLRELANWDRGDTHSVVQPDGSIRYEHSGWRAVDVAQDGATIPSKEYAEQLHGLHTGELRAEDVSPKALRAWEDAGLLVRKPLRGTSPTPRAEASAGVRGPLVFEKGSGYVENPKKFTVDDVVSDIDSTNRKGEAERVKDEFDYDSTEDVIVLYHSGDKSIADDVHFGTEPNRGEWVREVLDGATDDQGAIDAIAREPAVTFLSDAPDWVVSKVARKLGKNDKDVTLEDVREHGHLAVFKVDADADVVRAIDPDSEGFTNATGRESYERWHETPLYSEGDVYTGEGRLSETPFGVERGDYFTTESVSPEYTLTGDGLVEFLQRKGVPLPEAPTPRAAAPATPPTPVSAANAPVAPYKGKFTDEVEDLRTMDSHADAYAVAKGQPHLRRVSADGTGDFVGAPLGVDTAARVRTMRDDYDKLVELGAERGADWYKRMGENATRLAGRNPKRTERFTKENAMTSPQATPRSNLGFQLQGHNALVSDSPRDIVHTGRQARQMADYHAGGPDGLSLKTGPFSQAMDPNRPPTIGGTHDIWDGRAMGYRSVGKDGKLRPWDAGFSENQHRFLDYELVLAVQRANDKKLLGRSDWDADQIQAASWAAVGGKDRLVGDASGKLYGGDLNRAMDAMSDTDFPPDFAVNATAEKIPSASGKHLPGMAGQSLDARRRYTNEASWIDEDGRDILYDAADRYQLPSEEYTGASLNPNTGILEHNPANQSRPLMAFDTVENEPKFFGQTVGRHGELAGHDQDALNSVEKFRSMMDAQEAGAWNQFTPVGQRGVRGSDANTINISAPSTLGLPHRLQGVDKMGQQKLGALHKIAADPKYGYDNKGARISIQNAGNTSLVDFGATSNIDDFLGDPSQWFDQFGQPLSHEALNSKIKKMGAANARARKKSIGGLSQDLSDAGLRVDDISPGLTTSGYIDNSAATSKYPRNAAFIPPEVARTLGEMGDHLKDIPTNGQGTRELLEQIESTPAIMRQLDSPAIRQKVLDKIDRDENWAASTGMRTSAELQNLRRIFAEGGFKALRAAVDAGKIALPVAAAVLGLSIGETQDRQSAA